MKGSRILQKISDDKISFGDLMEWYFSLASVQNKTSCSQWKGQIGKFCSAFGSRAVGSLTVADLKEHQIRRQAEGLKPASIDLEIQLAGQMVRMAEMSDKISIACLKPFSRLKNLEKKGGNARTRRWEIHEYVAVLPHLPRHIQQALTLAMYTGMRVPSEILKLTWDMVDWKKGFINLPAEITKARTARRIPITAQLARILKGIPHHLHCPNVIVFRGRGIDNFNQASLQRACANAGLVYGERKEGGLIMHDTRRSVSTFMENLRIPESHRKLIVGHKLKGMDVHYVHPSDGELLDSMAKYHEWLEEKRKVATQDATQSPVKPTVDA